MDVRERLEDLDDSKESRHDNTVFKGSMLRNRKTQGSYIYRWMRVCSVISRRAIKRLFVLILNAPVFNYGSIKYNTHL